MELEYSDHDDKIQTESVAEYLYNEVLFRENWRSLFRDKVILEQQPHEVCFAMGRLIEKLMEKNILSLDDLKYIANNGWDRKANSLKIKDEKES